MKFMICNRELEDSFAVSADTVDEAIDIVRCEIEKRNWNEDDCYSIRPGDGNVISY